MYRNKRRFICFAIYSARLREGRNLMKNKIFKINGGGTSLVPGGECVR